MSKTTASKSGAPTEGTANNNKGGVSRTNLNIRNLPTRVTGFPESLFTKYSVEIVITGPNQVTQRLRALDQDGNPGKYVQLEDALRLCRAAGFVRASEKEVTRNEDTEKARMLFYQGKLDERKVSDPKAFTRTILSCEENLNKSRAALDRAGDTVEDANAVAFLSKQLASAKEVLDTYISRRNEGKKCTIRELAFELEMPASMVSKTLTGYIDVPANGRLWTALFGRELDKFCNLTVKEIKTFSEKTLRFYYSEQQISQFRALCTESEMQKAFGTTKPLNEKQKEKYLSQPIPIRPPLGLTAMLKRAEATKASIRVRQVATAIFPKLIEAVNNILSSHYICPPTEVSRVREYWETLAGETLQEPDLVSSSYRSQTLERLEEDEQHSTKPIKKTPIDWDVYIWSGLPLHARTTKITNSNIRNIDLEEYNPPEIIGFEKKPKRKEKQRRIAARKNDLTPESKRYLKALKKNGTPPETLVSVTEFLESFLYLEMQNLASQIVYLTCRLSLKEAKKTILQKEEGEEDSDSEEESDDGGTEEEALPEPIEPDEGFIQESGEKI